MRAALLALVVVAATFAGCTGDGKEDAAGDAPRPAIEFQGVRAVIRGAITYDFSPVAGANVTAEPDGDSAVTDAAGTFSLSVLPGRYVLRVQADGYLDASRFVEAYNETSVEIELLTPPSTAPYDESFPFRGFMECSVAAPGVSAYGGGQGTSANCLPLEPPSALQPPTNDRHTFLFDAASNLSSLLVEVAWDAGSNPAAARFLVLLEQAGSGGEGGLVHKRLGGTSPVRLELTPSEVLAAGLAAGGALQVRVFVDAGAAPGLAVQQSFDVVASLFYFEPHDRAFTALP